MATAKQVIQSVLLGGVAERTLFAPLVSAAACAVTNLGPEEFLTHPTKLTNTLRDLQQGLALDIVIPESGSHLVAEAAGAELTWNTFPPDLNWSMDRIDAFNLEGAGRLPTLLDVIDRLKYMLRERAAIGLMLDGPQRLSVLSGGKLSLDEAAQILLNITKQILSKGGVDILWFREEGPPPPDGEEWMSVMDPLWGSIRFFQTLPALHLAGKADGWLDLIEGTGPICLPCFDPVQSPLLADRMRHGGNFGIIVPAARLGTDGDEEGKETYRSCLAEKDCVLVTNDGDWFGHVPPQAFKKGVERLRDLF